MVQPVRSRGCSLPGPRWPSEDLGGRGQEARVRDEEAGRGLWRGARDAQDARAAVRCEIFIGYFVGLRLLDLVVGSLL